MKFSLVKRGIPHVELRKRHYVWLQYSIPVELYILVAGWNMLTIFQLLLFVMVLIISQSDGPKLSLSKFHNKKPSPVMVFSCPVMQQN